MTDFLSPSRLVEFQRCGEAWRRRHLEEDFVPPSLPALVGRSVREAALTCLRRKKEQGAPPTPEEAADLAAEAYGRGLLQGVHLAPEDVSSAPALIGEGKDNAVALAGLFCRELLPSLSPLLAGEKVLLDLGLPLPVAVTLDCCTTEGALHGLATASRKWNADRAHASPAPALWPAALGKAAGMAPSRMAFDVLVSTRTPALQSVETTRSASDLALVLRQFRLMIASVGAGIFPPAAPESRQCSPRWCGYFYTCPHVPAPRRSLPPSFSARAFPG
ncbi:hypothetical protein [Mailhella massiliensis]|uniref:Uncharacterized protein n=1 Tax=Mailhella massiliensis TaxID=1903261 RepID=A0A921AWB3_9BACT|nr:hypothetical protein [Mailhella massiliensis]HJD97313.1 hypothetical protein [Mailhella massiliensis]